MYQPQRRKKKGVFWFFAMLLVAVAVGLGIGYAGAKLSILPGKIEAAPKNTIKKEQTLPEKTDNSVTEEVSKPVSLSTTVPIEPETPPKSGYLVKITDGKVCVFTVDDKGNTKYSQTLEVYLGRLPESDQKKLKEGIYIKTRTELAELMEDYSS